MRSEGLTEPRACPLVESSLATRGRRRWFQRARKGSSRPANLRDARWRLVALEPAVAEIDLTAGSGNDFDDITYLTIGVGSTGQSGAIDVDFVRVAAGVHAPAPGGPQVPAMSLWGLAIAGMLIVCGGIFLLRRQSPGMARL